MYNLHKIYYHILLVSNWSETDISAGGRPKVHTSLSITYYKRADVQKGGVTCNMCNDMQGQQSVNAYYK